MTITEQRSLNRPLALVCARPLTDVSKKNGEERELNAEFLEFALEELHTMQQKVGELRFAIAAMTTLIKDKLEHI